jgi:hypothetical protein
MNAIYNGMGEGKREEFKERVAVLAFDGMMVRGSVDLKMLEEATNLRWAEKPNVYVPPDGVSMLEYPVYDKASQDRLSGERACSGPPGAVSRLLGARRIRALAQHPVQQIYLFILSIDLR